ncbi:CoA protein activase [Natranaerobius trueperi]|uniref:CoA protein activase n=2 Tax=Natranaerobius trueperi TaxID=759412 RepID=A0A226BZY4_9FIRM|nr:CoA protein activase [Natranaerobius trueperi]
MGNLSLALNSLFKSLGLQTISPPPITKKTMDIGTKYSPEFACLPLKINMGNYIEALELGADTIIMLGGQGPCRFGYYAQIQRRILTELGYNFEMIIIESPEDNARELASQLKKVGNYNSWKHVLTALYLTFNKLKVIDELDKKMNEVRPTTDKKDQLNKIYKDIQNEIFLTTSNKELNDIYKEMNFELNKLKNKEIDPIKIAIIGDIYIMTEHQVNMNIEKKLGELGAYVERTIFLSDWILNKVFLEKFGVNRNKPIYKESQPFLNNFVGGHGRESVGQAVLKAKHGFDGLVHMMPFTCTPEIVAQNILPHVSNTYDISLLTIIIDENTGEAGLVTRLEAFYDLLERKRESSKIIS